MRWVTRSHLHLDRVATPWLIRRFVDPEAVFEFVDWADVAPAVEGTIAFGLPDVDLSSHDERGTSFRKVMDRYDLQEPALQRMERIVACGVAHALRAAAPPGLTPDDAALGVALDLLGRGLGVAFDDFDHLSFGLGLYEAVYTYCQIELLPPEIRVNAPKLPPARVAFLRRALERSV